MDFSGSTFVAVSGHDDQSAHLTLILRAAHDMMGVVGGMTHADGSPLAVRIGIHTGPLTTGARCAVSRLPHWHQHSCGW